MPDAFVTGASGAVGRHLVAALGRSGWSVAALARSEAAAETIRKAGGRPVAGDLEHADPWLPELRDADAVWHLALPRLWPPVRGPGARRLAREGGRAGAVVAGGLRTGQALVAVSCGLVCGDRASPAGEDAPVAPLRLAMGAAAAERALGPAGARIVRLPWVYGEAGLMADVARGLVTGHYRIVGDGTNRWSLISAADAGRALLCAVELEPGVAHAAETEAPTQEEVVYAICSRDGLRHPDRVARGIAAIGMGRALSAALGASQWIVGERLAAAGWVARDSWRTGLVSPLTPAPAAPEGG
jgi:nucleoside-diphosphate-sugar epimerase